MNRRNFVSAATSAGLAAGSPPVGSAPSIFELRCFHLRNGSQVQKTADFLGKYFLPAAQRAGVGPMGFFAALIGEQAPFALALTSYPTLNAMAEAMEKMASDKDFQKGFDEYNSLAEPTYIRMENSLLRGFETWPNVVPQPPPKR